MATLSRSSEIQGRENTFLIARALGMAQEAGGVALLDDTEGSYNLEWIHVLGVNPDTLGYQRSATVSEHLQVTKAFIGAYQSLGLESPGLSPVIP